MHYFLASLVMLVVGLPGNSNTRGADAYKPINEIRSIASLVSGTRANTRADADRFLRALNELTLVRPYPLKLDDGIVIWRMELEAADTYRVRLMDQPCLEWNSLANRFGAKFVLSPHWEMYEAEGRYFKTGFMRESLCANEFTIKVR